MRWFMPTRSGGVIPTKTRFSDLRQRLLCRVEDWRGAHVFESGVDPLAAFVAQEQYRRREQVHHTRLRACLRPDRFD